ncbi:uncharacterized protein J4E79_008604 [Alternaria viburni]|uniref:uncharacterized protein n=1 Tax=Alternaria viburni TaxID=566460 RepID=UPI0020C445D8|nr:uncharacterized protein J4E79_008604 [Alternaria viburni]KAI4653091.1 hypothetical protein J4E79_008604 [Alternaria viburni]
MTGNTKVTYSGKQRRATGAARPSSPLAGPSRASTETQSHYFPSSPPRGRDDFSRARINQREVEQLQLDAGQVPTTVLPIPVDRQDKARDNARRPRFDYGAELKKGLTFVAAAAYAEELADYHAVARSMNESDFRVAAVYLMASIPAALLEAIVGGNLCIAARSNDDIDNLLYDSKSMWHIRANDKNAPGIYIRFLVDKDGNAPTPNQYLRVAKRLRDYVSGDDQSFEAAASLDNIKGTTKASGRDISKGHYRFLNGSEQRVMQILTWCTALEDRIHELPADELDTPMQRPCTYVGYSVSVSQRLHEHDEGGTSWFQHMVQAAFQAEVDYPLFSFEGHAVCFLQESEAPVAEVLISVITDSMIETGGGFGVYQAGIQTTSALLGHLPTREWPGVWKACARWREDQNHSDGNLFRERALLEAHHANPTAASNQVSQSADAIRRDITALEADITRLQRDADDYDGEAAPEDDLDDKIQELEDAMNADDPDSDDDSEARQSSRAVVEMLRRRQAARTA